MMMIATAMIVKDIQIPQPYSLEGKVKSPLSQIIDSQHCTEEGKLRSLVLSGVYRNVSIEKIYETDHKIDQRKSVTFSVEYGVYRNVSQLRKYEVSKKRVQRKSPSCL